MENSGIPYKYECPLKLGSYVIYPDFTILKISERKVIYLEHLGMMDDHDYANNAIRRINAYQLNGIIYGDRLFTTMETKQNPLDVRVLKKLIDNQFK